MHHLTLIHISICIISFVLLMVFYYTAIYYILLAICQIPGLFPIWGIYEKKKTLSRFILLLDA